MSKSIKITISDEDYAIIAEEAASRLITPSAFTKTCIASFVNKGRQERVFGKTIKNTSE